MRRIYRLTVREQLMVYRTLREYLGEKIDEETVLDKQIKAREEALAAMLRVAEHYHLPTGKAPKVVQHREAPSDVTREWTASKVIRAWGRYRFAQKAFEGKEVPETPAHRAIRRLTSGKAREPETYLNAIHQWLETNPASTTSNDYDAYAKQHNSEVLAGKHEGQILCRFEAARKGLALTWSQILEIARGEADYDELRNEYVEKLAAADTGALDIISASGVGHLLACRTTRATELHRKGDFPVPVLVLSKINGWYKSDILAHRDKRPFPERQHNELRPLVLDTLELAELLGITRGGLTTGLIRTHSTVPPSDGRLGVLHYWLKDKTETWIAERQHPQSLASRSR